MKPLLNCFLSALSARPFRRKTAAARGEAGLAAAPADAEGSEPTARADETALLPFVARLIATFRRPGVASTDAPPAVAGDDAGASAPPARRSVGVASRRRMGIAAASLALLAVVATPSALLGQSHRDRAGLEAKLTAIEHELERTAPAAGPTTTTRTTAAAQTAAVDPAPASQSTTPILAATQPLQRPASGTCDVSSVERLSAQLKDCIDAFNDASARSRPTRPASNPR